MNSYVDKKIDNLETIMLFRCTSWEYAERFIKTGNIRFGKPIEWVEEYKKHGKGRGDLLEGCFASIQDYDENTINFCSSTRPNVETLRNNHNGMMYFRSADVLNHRTFCLFGLSKAHFTREDEGEDRNTYPTGSIGKRYFEDFSGITKDNYESIPKKQRPALLIINNPYEFFDRLKNALYKLGLSPNEFCIQPVEYIDKKIPFLVLDPMPSELFFKDLEFDIQSEIRVVLTPKNPSIIKLFEEKNGILDIGNMDDIAEIYDYYFNDFNMQLRGNNLLFALPKPIETPITDPMTVMGHIHQIYRDELPGELLSIEKRERLVNEAAEFLHEKFGISFDRKTLTFVSKDRTTTWKLNGIWEILYNHGCAYHGKGEFEKAIDQYTKAIMLDPQRAAAWYNRAVSYYKLKEYQNMINDMNKAIELEPTNERYIRERDEQLRIHRNNSNE